MNDYILELNNITKSFPGVLALDSVTLNIKKGSVLGLVGENGAGKSTLMKILTGVYSKDSGSISIDGKEVRITSPLEAQKLGLSIIFQEFNIVNSLSIAENIFTGRLRQGNKGPIRWRQINKDAAELLKQVGLDVSPSTKVERLSIAGKQMVEIAKALSFNSKVIVMDEPSATLTNRELENLFQIIEDLKSRGITVIYISHRLDEIFHLCDTVTVMRDGTVIESAPIENWTREKIVSCMIGRELSNEFPSRERTISNDIVLEVDKLSRNGIFNDISFQLHKGEILGLAGLVGAGRTEIVRAIFGADKKSGGSIRIDGRYINIKNPIDAIRGGIALVTEDRKSQGLVLKASVAENTTLSTLDKISSLGFLNKRKEQDVSKHYVELLKTKTPFVSTAVSGLSGGNQQKVVLAKWLLSDAKVLILDEPTRGIDVGAKYEIYKLIYELAAQGKAILLISSEMPEITNLCDRILVIHEGQFKKELRDNERTPEAILKHAIIEKKGGYEE